MTLYGWDLSHYDAPTIGDAVAEGYSFFTHKAGGDAEDTEIGTWWNEVRNIPPETAMLGAYWVLYPSMPATRADRFIARLDDQCPGWRTRPFILQVDCEIWDQNSATKPGLADIQAFCDRLTQHAPRLRPIVYASAGQYGDSLAGLRYPLWNARYVLGYTAGYGSVLYTKCGGDSGKGWNTYSGQVPAIWQFTSSATIAGQTTSDANAFRGTFAELHTLLAPGWETPMSTLDTTDHAAIRQDAFLGAGYDIGQAALRATSGNPADASANDRAIRNGWAALISYGIATEHKEIMALLQQLTAGASTDNVITAVNSAQDALMADVRNALAEAVTEVKTAVTGVPDAVLAKLQDTTVTDAEVAALLDQWLGARKPGVLAYLNG